MKITNGNKSQFYPRRICNYGHLTFIDQRLRPPAPLNPWSPVPLDPSNPRGRDKNSHIRTVLFQNGSS